MFAWVGLLFFFQSRISKAIGRKWTPRLEAKETRELAKRREAEEKHREAHERDQRMSALEGELSLGERLRVEREADEQRQGD